LGGFIGAGNKSAKIIKRKKMNKILYYPYINVPRTEWTLRTLLYYESIGSIVPQEYFYNPERHYEPFMLELVRNELVVPINPITVLERPWQVSEQFLKYIEKNNIRLERARLNFSLGRDSQIHLDKFKGARIHSDKFDENILHHLEQLGLARRGKDRWYDVESKTANHLMKFLATIISSKLEMLPTTDYVKPAFFRRPAINQHRKRETILSNLIPFPEEINLKKVKKFKEKHFDLLDVFKNKVELIVLDPNIIEGTDLFNEKVRELQFRKEELSARMNESQFGNIIFGTVCGIIGAVKGLASAETTGAIIGAFPGFASAIHSALKFERAENVFDQSGLKYLALADKRLRNK